MSTREGIDLAQKFNLDHSWEWEKLYMRIHDPKNPLLGESP